MWQGSRPRQPQVTAPRPPDRRALRAAIAPYQEADLARSLRQLASTFLPLLVLVAGMYASLATSYWLTLALAVPVAGLVVRTFIIQHDCGHGSFFRSRRANDALGRLCSLITLTPYRNWRRQHAGHHAVWNNLDRRESGTDIYSTCLTVDEYRALSPARRWGYRTIQHPLIALLLLPPLVFLALYRVPFDTPQSWRKERASVYLTNLALVALAGGLGLVLGFEAVAAVHLPIMILAAIVGVWLFSVQHRFEDVHWSRQQDWDPATAALRGSSYLKLPCVLQWFTGNIGFHHVHHLNPRIPNYRLEECHRTLSAMASVPTLTLGRAFSASRYVLWDETSGRMVRFSDVTLESMQGCPDAGTRS